MRLAGLVACTLAIVSAALADFVEVWYMRGLGWSMIFNWGNERMNVPYNVQGCTENPGPPGLYILCMDVNNYGGYFMWSAEGVYRCLTQESYNNYGENAIPEQAWVYNEVGCNYGKSPAAHLDYTPTSEALDSVLQPTILPEEAVPTASQCPVPATFPDKVFTLADLNLPRIRGRSRERL